MDGLAAYAQKNLRALTIPLLSSSRVGSGRVSLPALRVAARQRHCTSRRQCLAAGLAYQDGELRAHTPVCSIHQSTDTRLRY